MKKIIFCTLSFLPLLAVSQTAPIEGVNYSGFQNFGSQSCMFLNAAIYSCNEVGVDGKLLQTQVIDFDSKAELCSKLRSENLHSVSTFGSSYIVASAVRSKYINENCLGSVIVTEPSASELIKTMVCSIAVEANDGAKGASGFMQIPIAASGATGQIYATMEKTKVGPIAQIKTSFHSGRYVRIDYRFLKGSANSSDQLTVTAHVQNGSTASIQGEARSGVSLNIDQVGDVQKAEVKCIVEGAKSISNQTSADSYSCNTLDNSAPGNYGVAAPISTLISKSVELTKPEAQTEVSMSAEIPAILNFKAKLRTSGNSTIVGKASLNEPSKFSVNNLSKSVKVNCK